MRLTIFCYQGQNKTLVVSPITGKLHSLILIMLLFAQHKNDTTDCHDNVGGDTSQDHIPR